MAYAFEVQVTGRGGALEEAEARAKLNARDTAFIWPLLTAVIDRCSLVRSVRQNQ